MLIYLLHVLFHFPNSEIVYPPSDYPVQPLDSLIHTDSPSTTCQLFQCSFELCKGICMRSCFPFVSHFHKTKAQIFQLTWFCYLCFGSVYLKPELSLYPVCNCVHDPACRRTAFHHYHAVICIADKMQVSCFQLLIQFIQHDIGQQWG